MKENKNEAVEANQQMDQLFYDFRSRNYVSDGSEEDRANNEIQEQFYGNDKADNSLPFHVDVNNPPIKN
ncbi:hypothetical protein [Neobacillus sp. PS2-9]|uniref:hypothetical protein n=1 Tax=Neobacillus sp. PS2-9 TaxID=3070676 RepID=UPI0027E19E5B|nr:hypothetical protein [Neobacillus sp. PS2-9]WML60393.1 hypothetical protein RCG25_11760 [Neobacillus sp. PS2-9]